MKKVVLSSPQDYLALLIRRKWWILMPLLCLSTVVGVVTYYLPNIYTSETLILVEPREVPDDFVRDLITLDSAQRLSAVQQTLLSRTNLLRILSEFRGELVSLQDLNEDKKISTLLDSIDIEAETSQRETSFLRIRYENRNPELAQRITSRLASLLIEYDNRQRQEQVFGTTEFLQNEVDKVSLDLQAAEKVLAELKRTYRYELPAQLDTNLRTLDRLHIQLQANTEALDRSTGLRLALEQQISQTDPTLVGEFEVPGLSPRVQEYREKQQLYRELTNRYTAKHPDVQRLVIELDRLKSEISPELSEVDDSDDSEEKKISVTNPVYRNLLDQLSEVQRDIQTREREREWIQAEIKKYTVRAENTPGREQEMASILRTHSELSNQYEDLKSKLIESELAESLESRQKGENFIIMDPANYPMQHSKPNRLLILLVGLFFSLSVGVGMAYAVDSLDQTLWTHREVEELLGVPVLAEIPEIVTQEDLQNNKKRRRLSLLLLFVATGMVFAALYSVYVNAELKAVAAGYFQPIMKLATRLLIG